MSPAELNRMATQLFGPRYQSRLAVALGILPSTVSRWLSGAVAVPGPVIAALTAWMRLHELGIAPPPAPGTETPDDPPATTPRPRSGRKPKYVALLEDDAEEP